MIKLLTYFLFLPLLGFASSAQFNYQGRLFDDLGEPIDSGTTEITIQVLNPSADCLLFEETHNIDMNGTQGFFSLTVGGGTQNVATAPLFSLTATLSNRNTLADANMNCAGNSYTPAANDKRVLKVLIDGTPLQPNQIIQPVPYATIASDAEKLEGKSANDFLQDDAGNVTQTKLQNFFDTASTLANNQSLRWNASGSTWEVFTPGAAGSGINSVTAGTAINVSGTVNDPIIAVDESAIDYANISNTPDLAGDGTSSVHFNNLTNIPADLADGDDDTQLSEAEVDSFADNNGYFEADGSIAMSANLNAGSNRIINVTDPISAQDAATKNYVDGKTWTLGDISDDGSMAAANTSDYYTQTNMQTSGQSQLHWGNLTNIPADIADGDANTTYGQVTGGADGLMIAADKIKLDSLSSFSLGAADGTPANAIEVDNDGNVGIGTTSPSELLDVNGRVRGTELCIAGDCRSNWPSSAFGVGNSGFVGALTYEAKNNCLWQYGSAGWGNFPNDNQCNTPSVSGTASAPASKIPGITFTSLPAGVYKVTLSGTYLWAPGTTECGFRLSDGTNAGGSTYVYDGESEASLTAYFRYTTSQSNITFQVQGRYYSGPGYCELYGDDTGTSYGGDPSITVVRVDGNTSAVMLADTDGNTSINTELNSDENILRFTTSGDERMIINATGNVGIGTTSPSVNLEVAGGIRIGDIAGAGECDAADEAGRIRYNGGNLDYCNGASWQTLGTASGGEVNTGNDMSTSGQPIFLGKIGTELRFAGVDAGSNMVTIATNGTNNTVEIDLALSNIDISNLQNAGTMATAATSDYYTQTNMQTSGQAQLHFGNLTNLPAGLADGDNDTTALSAMTGNSDDIAEGSTNLFISAAEQGKLTNIETGATADMTAGEILTALSGVDGAASGLDADLFDGQDSSHYLNYNNLTNPPAIPSSIADISSGIDDNADALAITIDSDERVGVGTATPNHPVEVNGVVSSLTGGFRLPDGTVIDEASDLGAGGTVTSITLGSGIPGSAITGSGTLNVAGGDGIIANADDLAIDLATNPGLEFSSNQLRAKIGTGMIRDGSGLSVDEGVGGGQILGADDVPQCTAGQKLQWTPSSGWSCVTDVDTDTTYSASDMMTAIQTLDTNSSGLNSDTLDGQQGSYYLDYGNLTNPPTIPANITELTVGNDSISGDAIDGGAISDFASTGIDDNASSTAITVDSGGNVGIGAATPSAKLDVHAASGTNSLYITNDGIAAGDRSMIWFNLDDDGTPNWAGLGLYDSDGGLALTGGSSLSTPDLYISDSGNVAVGHTSPEDSALLDMSSTTQGFLPPRMDTSQRTGISSPAEGLIVYDTDEEAPYVYKTTGGWTKLADATELAFHVHRNGSNQTGMTSSDTLVNWTTKDMDTNNNFNTSTDRFTPTVAGTYFFYGQAICSGNDTGFCRLRIRKNGSQIADVQVNGDATSSTSANTSIIVSMNGTTDYVDMTLRSSDGGTMGGSADNSFFGGFLISGGTGGGGGPWSDNSGDIYYNSGSVGVGTTSPTSKLHVEGDLWVGTKANPRINIDNDSGTASRLSMGADSGEAWVGTTTNSDFYISTNSAERLRVDNSGNVGVGTTTPAEKLHVEGNVRGTQLCIGTDCRSSWPSGITAQTTLSCGASSGNDCTTGGCPSGYYRTGCSAYGGQGNTSVRPSGSAQCQCYNHGTGTATCYLYCAQ